jgi:DHA1 family bicyclomycin/chloramphenicol resistance-like MFS transporter
MLGYALGQIILGVLSDIYGRKKIFLLSALAFAVVSFLAGYIRPNIQTLIVARFAQGFSIAGLSVISRAIAADLFSGIILVKIMAYISLSWSLGPIIGPFIGGYLAHFFHWEANFYFFSLYGLVILIHAILTLLETNLHRQPICIKIIGNTIKKITVHPIFFFGSLLVAFLYSSMVVFNAVSPFLIQTQLDYSVVHYAKFTLILGLSNFFGNYSNRKLLTHIASMKIALFGVIFSLCVVTITVLLSTIMKMTIYTIILPTLLLFFCEGLIVPNVMGKIMSLFPENAGTENAIFGIILAFGVFLFTLLSTLLNARTMLPLACAYFFLFGGGATCFFTILRLDTQRR